MIIEDLTDDDGKETEGQQKEQEEKPKDSYSFYPDSSL